MADKKQEETFRVIDRRLFTAEGELRKEALEQERADAGVAPIAPSAQKPASSVPAAPANPPAAAAPAPASAEAPAPSRHFQTLVGLIMRYAEGALAGYLDPRTGQTVVDIESIRTLIDVLDDLREKTRGNLAPEDSELLLEVIGNLKLTYIELETAAAQPPAGPGAAAGAPPAAPRGRR